MGSADGRRVARIGDAGIRMLLEMLGVLSRQIAEGRRSFCREREHMNGPLESGGCDVERRRLLENHMRVGASHAERAHAGAPWSVLVAPPGQARVDVKRAFFDV